MHIFLERFDFLLTLYGIDIIIMPNLLQICAQKK